ncbi:MAG: NrsF family protein [Bauldia sp.]
MPDARIAGTIDQLAGRLRPVRRLRPPLLRGALWLCAFLVVAVAAYLVLKGNLGLLDGRAYVLPALIASVATAALAALAAFQLSLPDRSDAWALLPLPTLLLWVLFSGLGCLAELGDGTAWGSTWNEVRECLLVIVGTSIPLAVLLIAMLRRARPDRAIRVAVIGGLACAAAAGSILILVHPHNSSVLDLLVHAGCVAAIVGFNALVGGRILRRTRLRDQV